MNTIASFFGRNAFLSNFFMRPMEYKGQQFPSAEFAYQWEKTNDPEEKKAILACKTSAQAKQLGKAVTLRNDWEDVKLEVMRDIQVAKFSDPELAFMLLQTGDARLVEGNYWHDHFWGVSDGWGANWLGRILMGVREEIREKTRA